MNIDVRKSAIYVISICLMMSLLLALWATEGFQHFAAWKTKPLAPFTWAIPAFGITFGPLLLIRYMADRLQMRTGWDLWGRGLICGLMISAVWAPLYLVNMMFEESRLGVYLIAAGWIIAAGLGAIGIGSEAFLRENLVGIGIVTGVAGMALFGSGRPLLGDSIGATGVFLVLLVTLICKRVRIPRGRYHRSYEITYEESPVEFSVVVIALGGLLGWVLFDLIKRLLGSS